jgi:transposase InsO family protein
MKAMKKDRVNLITWHRRFVHLSVPNIIRASKMVEGMDIRGLAIPKHACESCRIVNATILQGHQQMTPAKRRGERVFLDIGGGHIDMPPSRRNGAHYWLILIDQFDGYVTVKFLKLRQLAAKAIRLFVEESDRAGHRISTIYSDNAGEFIKNKNQAYFRNKGIKWEFAAAYTHSQNAFPERMGRTLLTPVRAVLHDSKLPRDLWDEIMRGVAFVKNLSPRRGHEKIAYEARFDQKPDVKSLRVLGCLGWLTIPPEVRSARAVIKIDARAIRCRLLSYNSLGKQYIVWVPENDEIKHVRDVKFSEGSDPELYGSPDDDYGKFVQPPEVADRQNPHELASDDKDHDLAPEPLAEPSTPERERAERTLPTPHTGLMHALVKDFDEHQQVHLLSLLEQGFAFISSKQGQDHQGVIEPSSYNEAINGADAAKWQEAMAAEIRDLVSRGA